MHKEARETLRQEGKSVDTDGGQTGAGGRLSSNWIFVKRLPNIVGVRVHQSASDIPRAVTQPTFQVEQELADTMGRISGGPSDAVEAAAPPRTPSRPLASSLFAVRRGRQPLDLEEAGSTAAYVTAANEFLTASGNVLGNATRHRQEGERR